MGDPIRLAGGVCIKAPGETKRKQKINASRPQSGRLRALLPPRLLVGRWLAPPKVEGD